MTPGPHRLAQVGFILLLASLAVWIAGCAFFPETQWGANPLVPWQIWPPFHDLRIVLTAIEAVRQGVDPIAGELPYNYPPLWLQLAPTGLGPEHTRAAGLVIGFLFLACLGCIGWSVASASSDWGWFGLVWCPPAMFALERGNNDSIIFVLITLAGAWPQRKNGLPVATAALWLASALKIYPLAALGVLPPGRAGRLRLASILLVSGFGLYVALNAPAIAAAIGKTPQSPVYSYGAALPVVRLVERRPALVAPYAAALQGVRYALIGGALILAGTAFLAGRRAGAAAAASDDDVSLRWYHGGAIVYLATYVLFISWGYRLIFLLLCVPWLQRLAGQAAHRRRAQATLFGIALVTWGVAFPAPVPFLFTQAASLGLALLLAYECGRQPPALWHAWATSPNHPA